MLELFASPLTGWIGGILVGIFVGAAGKYYADKYTDRRKHKERLSSLRKEFERCQKRMPELFEEMRDDLGAHPLKSEFVLLDVRLAYGRFPEEPLVYFMNDDKRGETYRDAGKSVLVHSHLLDKLRVLESAGFVRDISRTDVPYFRMSDQFKQMLRR
jgi:hypothetical protein